MRLSAQLLKDQYKLLVCGSGAGGSAIANYFSRTIAVSQIAVVDPNDKIYYQPGFSLIGGNLMDPKEVVRKREEFHPKLVRWFKNEIREFAPKKNTIVLDDGREIGYEFMVVATGCQTRFDLIEGLPEAFKSPGVCSIYSYELAQKTRDEIQNFKGGTAVFSHPNAHIKCAGATQKICYMAEDIFGKNGVRDKSTIIYNTPLDKVFGIERYAETLEKLIDQKHIVANTRRNLFKVDPSSKTAFFEILDDNAKSTGKTDEVKYDLIHIGPPCTPIKPLCDAAAAGEKLVDAQGWVDVNPQTLQSRAYDNVFALGDACGTSNGKTAAACATQFRVVKHNLTNKINGKEFSDEYDGYSSCPFMVDSSHGMIAEFDYKGQPVETLPIKQNKPRYLFYLMNKYMLPPLYWNLMLKGLWNGPEGIRKVLHLGLSK